MRRRLGRGDPAAAAPAAPAPPAEGGAPAAEGNSTETNGTAPAVLQDELLLPNDFSIT